mmetsp:Transcript_35698/g.53215  ORF Transcript_35698/g.53215 Transcript_35698/m.53215 type:complete len:199 (-) Transcript_35698:139-735(-)
MLCPIVSKRCTFSSHREKHLGHKIDLMAKEAKVKMASGDKKGALNAMKRRKLYQSEQEKISNVKMTLEAQAFNLESASSTAQAFQAMNAGNKTMKKIRTEVGIDQVDDVMDDIQEEMQMANEVNQAIGQAVDPTMGMVDDDDLLAELQAMDAMDLEQQFDEAQIGKVPNKPLKTKPGKAGLSVKEAQDLNRLQAELAM